jgi:hypothetical protein
MAMAGMEAPAVKFFGGLSQALKLLKLLDSLGTSKS